MPAYNPKKQKTKKEKKHRGPTSEAPQTSAPQTSAQQAPAVVVEPAAAPQEEPKPTKAPAPAVVPSANLPEEPAPSTSRTVQPPATSIGQPGNNTAKPENNPAQPVAVPAIAAPAPAAPPPPQDSHPPVFYARNAFRTIVVDDQYSSAYISVDSWMYPALLRLYSMGFLDTAFLDMRPWTRRSVLHMLQRSGDKIEESGNDQAIEIYEEVRRELSDEVGPDGIRRGTVYGLESVYARTMEISGQPVNNSFHLGSTIINDYGRPFAQGFNAIAGFSSLNEYGRFSLFVRSEYQHAPAYAGLTGAQAGPLFYTDEITPGPYNYSTEQRGPIAAQNPFRVVEANLSVHGFGHEFSFGKSDAWLSPAQGGAFAWSNNAENIYSFRIDRVEPLHVPYLSAVLGPLRYEFYVGSLKGHTAPNSPWVHAEKFAFRPTVNFEFGFERTIIWGGVGHEPVTIHTFLRGFFSFNDTSVSKDKLTRNDPGARFSQFDFSWRLPYLRKWLTFYTDTEVHDDVSSVSAPRRSALRPGLYLSHFPGAPKFDLRAEAATTDPSTSRSNLGQLFYWEVIQLQGYTNKGQIFGDWIGREAKGGQAWLTYHLSSNEWLQLSYRNAKTPHDFIPGGTTQNLFTANALLRLRPDLEMNAWVQYERWNIPLLKPGTQSDTTSTIQLTWYPKLHTR